MKGRSGKNPPSNNGKRSAISCLNNWRWSER
uniref:Uncharacterized protein n=1 Tax=Arundo donax TaxID=35708 RepID=A0A0A9FLQ0_ARUDO